MVEQEGLRPAMVIGSARLTHLEFRSNDTFRGCLILFFGLFLFFYILFKNKNNVNMFDLVAFKTVFKNIF